MMPTGLALPLPSNTITTSASGTNDIDVIAYNELSIASLTWVIMKQSDHRMAVRGAVERGGVGV